MIDQQLNNTEHKCAGRTDGYGGFTCVTCGSYHENERYKKSQPDKLIVDEVDLYKAIAYADIKNADKDGMTRCAAIADEILLLLKRYDIQYKK